MPRDSGENTDTDGEDSQQADTERAVYIQRIDPNCREAISKPMTMYRTQ